MKEKPNRNQAQQALGTLDKILNDPPAHAAMGEPPLLSGTARRKLIRWVDGVPLPVDTDVVVAGDKEIIKKVLEAAVALPYEGEGDAFNLWPELFGHTKLEVMMIRLARQAAGGDQDAIKIILDRLMGKPEQLSKSMEVTGTYKEFLELLKKKEETAGAPDTDGPRTIIDTSALG